MKVDSCDSHSRSNRERLLVCPHALEDPSARFGGNGGLVALSVIVVEGCVERHQVRLQLAAARPKQATEPPGDTRRVRRRRRLAEEGEGNLDDAAAMRPTACWRWWYWHVAHVVRVGTGVHRHDRRRVVAGGLPAAAACGQAAEHPAAAMGVVEDVQRADEERAEERDEQHPLEGLGEGVNVARERVATAEEDEGDIREEEPRFESVLEGERVGLHAAVEPPRADEDDEGDGRVRPHHRVGHERCVEPAALRGRAVGRGRRRLLVERRLRRDDRREDGIDREQELA